MFLPARNFTGRKVGYFFGNGDKGIGYYLDHHQVQHQTKETDQHSSVERKRKYDNLLSTSETHGVNLNVTDLDPGVEINAIFDQAEKSYVNAQLDGNSVKQLLLSLDKRISNNQKMRIKFHDDAEKFMESEIELHKEIENFHIVAAFPELYPVLLQNNAINKLLGLITHENTDISIATISLIQEMTEVDTLIEQVNIAKDFIDALIQNQGFELLVQNLSRLDETSDEDAQGVHNTMGIFENFLELQPDLTVHLCEKTYLLSFLLHRVRTKSFDANKLYCSEILSILLQSDIRNVRWLSRLPTDDTEPNVSTQVNGLELLLESIAFYRKKEIESSDEQECVENLFLCLCSSLMLKENQDNFIKLEGFELMMRCLQEQKYASRCVLNTVNYAITKHMEGCEKFVDCGGLKYIFPVLVGKGLKKYHKRKSSQREQRSSEQISISIISQLCAQLFQSANLDYKARITLKLVEQGFEKLLACCDLFDKYFKVLEKTENAIEKSRQRLLIEGDREAFEEYNDEDFVYIQRLDGGLFVLQQLSMIISFVCTVEPACLGVINNKLVLMEYSLVDVVGILQDLIQNMGESSAAKVEGVNQGIDESYKKIIIEWSQTLRNFISSN